MAAIRSASKRRREGGKIYVSGRVDGLETGYNYCVMYSYNGGAEKNMGNSGLPYTFISLAALPKGSSKRYSFTDKGAWVTDEGDGTYEIICNMVGVNCEHVHIHESTRSFSVTTPYVPEETPEETEEDPDAPPPTSECDEGALVCEYSDQHKRYMIKKCVNGKLVYEQWCGTDDACEDGTCIPTPAPPQIPTPPACEEGTTVCEYHEGQKRYLLKKCVNGKLVFERWCGADDACEEGVCVPKPKPTPTEPAPKPTPQEPAPAEEKYLSPDEAISHINAGRTCYIKCTLPILDTLPGIPYTPGAWVPPFCAITTRS